MLKGNIFNEMLLICDGFKKNIPDNHLFEPEFKTSKKINTIIKQLNQLSRSDAVGLLQLFNDINKMEHYNGSGWLDYKMHLSHLLKINGFEVMCADKEFLLINP